MAKSQCSPKRRARVVAWAACLVVGLVGCGDGLRLAPVEGVVTLDGAPLADAAVVFQPTGGGPVASGVTDAQGQFELFTANRPGAVVGTHQVAVTKQEIRGMADDAPSAAGVSTEWITPQRYSQPATSGLTVAIDSAGKHLLAGGDRLLLELTSP